MGDRLPLPALLSQALVAFTVEFDNEFEHRMPHRITSHSAAADGQRGPWLVSMAMWLNCMRFVGEQAMPVTELERLARTKTNLDGMRRWGYVRLEPDPAATRPKPPRSDLTIRATRMGRAAQDVWRPLATVIEDRWRERFGPDEVARFKAALWALARHGPAGLPDCLPILGYGLFTKSGVTPGGGEPDAEPAADPGLPLPTLLARVLLGFALRFERGSELSLAICADVLRVLDGDGVRVRDLPALSGVSKEAISMAMGVLEKKGVAVTGPDPAGRRWKVARLSPEGLAAQAKLPRAAGAYRERRPRAVRRGPRRPARRARALRGPPRDATVSPVPGPGALPGRLARFGPSTADAPPLPDGAPPGRLPRRQLNANPGQRERACSAFTARANARQAPAEDQRGPIGALAVADGNGLAGGADLDAVPAVSTAVARLPPPHAAQFHSCSATFVIMSRDAPRGRASDRSVSKRRMTAATVAASSTVCPSAAVSK